ncbi:MAG: M48 family metallopeptidase [Acidobacteriota bacterium]|nr:M48 family metallopeptidase [Acidobacteriota bacterium]
MKQFFRKTTALALTGMLVVTPVLAQDKSKLKPLEEKNDPTLIGKRDINKGSISFYSLDREVALGRQMANEIDRSTPLVTDPVINEFINRIAQNIVLHSDAKVPFTVKVIDAQEVNAFALPGGFLYVNRGLLEAAENEAEVAGVMAHEIAHVTARHGIEQASKGQLLQFGSIPLIFLGGLGGYVIQQVAGIALPLTFLKFSRGAEKEADRLGAQYMWASGYDPNALITFFEKLQAQEKRKPGTLEKIFSTHPMTGDRITEVRGLIERFPDRGEYQLSSSEFKDVKSRLMASRPKPVNSRDDKRPTLKRRPQTDNGDGSVSDSSDNGTPDRPVLKRRDSSTESESTSSSQSSEEGRPVLKRRENSADPQASGSESSSSSSSGEGRPVLKRREGAEAAESPAATKPESTSSSAGSTAEAPDRPKLKKNNETNDSTGENKTGQASGSSSSSQAKPPTKP